MNPVEEHRADAAAHILLRHFGYELVIRSALIVLERGAPSATEIDMVGVRRGEEQFDCFEFKVGGSDRNQGCRLRKQLRKRRASGGFSRVWGAWDCRDRVFKHCNDEGYGSLYVDGFDVNQLAVAVVETAPELPVRPDSRGYADLRRLVRMIRDQADLEQPKVLLACAGCMARSSIFRSWYPFAFDYKNNYEEIETGRAQHSPFCEVGGAIGGRVFAGFGVETMALRNGQWLGTIHTRIF